MHDIPVSLATVSNILPLFNALIILIGLLHGLVIIFFLTGLLRNNKKRQNNYTPFVSVIIAAHNEAQGIGDCLNTILDQSYPSDSYEIIVVDDRSTDETAEIAKTYSTQHANLSVVHIDSVPSGIHPKKNAITAGVKIARGEIIIETDADVSVGKKWIKSITSSFTPDVGLVVGSSTIRKDKNRFLENFQAVDFLMLVASAQGALGHGMPMGATGQNLAYRKKVFDEVGGLSIDTRRYVSNDILFLTKVTKTGWKIAGNKDRDAIVSTLAVEGWRQFFSQRTRWASNAYWKEINSLLLLMLGVNYFMNLFVLNGVFQLLSTQSISMPLVYLIIYKFVTEAIFLSIASAPFGRKDLLRSFPAWFMGVTPYIILVGLLGGIGIFKWKGYRVRSV